MKEIQLTKGKFALVDDEDYEWLSQWKWFTHSNGYAVRGEGTWPRQKIVLMHRAIMQVPSGMEVDHTNGGKLDNRRANLRICNHTENMRNRKSQSGGTSQFKGVFWDKHYQKWRAQIKVNNKRFHLGRFEKEVDAARSYDDAALEHHGEYARLNFPQETAL